MRRCVEKRKASVFGESLGQSVGSPAKEKTLPVCIAKTLIRLCGCTG